MLLSNYKQEQNMAAMLGMLESVKIPAPYSAYFFLNQIYYLITSSADFPELVTEVMYF
jgi:hypothetical protein